jgi:hypothetical protein
MNSVELEREMGEELAGKTELVLFFLTNDVVLFK